MAFWYQRFPTQSLEVYFISFLHKFTSGEPAHSYFESWAAAKVCIQVTELAIGMFRLNLRLFAVAIFLFE